MRWICLLAVAACSFTHGAAVSSGGGSADAAVPDAAPLDASYHGCTLTSTGVPMAAGDLGGSGGGTQSPDTVCDPGEVAVGMGFDYAPDGVGGQEGVVVDVNVRCGQLARDSTGHITTTYMDVQTTATNGICFTQVNSVAEQDCPPGSVVVGMTANEGGSSLYNTVAVQCAAVRADLTLSTTTTTLTFSDTGSYSDRPQSATCPAGTAFASFAVRDGCANDELGPKCFALACTP